MITTLGISQSEILLYWVLYYIVELLRSLNVILWIILGVDFRLYIASFAQ